MDLALTAFFIPFFCTLLGTGGMQKEVHKKKSDVIDSSVTAGGWWRFTPVRIRSLFLRSVAMGFYVEVLVGLPTILLVWAGVGGGTWACYSYTFFKGFWAVAVAMPVCALVFFAALDTRNFPELEFASLMNVGGRRTGGEAGDGDDGVDTEPIPLVGNVSHV
jgi:hypothetical protein